VLADQAQTPARRLFDGGRAQHGTACALAERLSREQIADPGQCSQGLGAAVELASELDHSRARTGGAAHAAQGDADLASGPPGSEPDADFSWAHGPSRVIGGRSAPLETRLEGAHHLRVDAALDLDHLGYSELEAVLADIEMALANHVPELHSMLQEKA